MTDRQGAPPDVDALCARLFPPRLAGAESVLLVHSAFGGLSRAGLRAESFCSALIGALRGGTLLMPTMTWRTVTPREPVFDEMRTASHTGILTEVFRTGFAGHRSLHPTHSVAGRGPLAGRLLASHHLGDTPCPATSPYGLMRGHDAHILLLGVGLECCTAIHHAEELTAPDLYLVPAGEAEDYTLIARDGGRHAVRLRRHRRLDRDFPKFTAELRRSPGYAEGTECATPWMRFALDDLYRLVFAHLVSNPRATLRDA